MFAIGDWTMIYYPPAKKCKLDSPWLGPHLVVSLAGWAVGVQLDPDSPVLMIHCQGLKKIPRPRGLVSWLQSDQTDPATTHPVIGASTVCQSRPVSTPSTVSGILSQQSLPRSPESLPQTQESLPRNLQAGVPVILQMGSICVDEYHVLHLFFRNRFDAFV